MNAPEVQAWFDRVDRQMATGDVAGAVTTAEAAVAQQPEAATLWNLYGGLLAVGGRVADGVVALERAAALDDKDPEPVRNAAGLYLALAAWDRALDAVERLLARTPRDAEAHRLMGAALAGAGAPVLAAARFRTAVTLDRRLVQGWLDLVAILSRLGQGEAARAATIDALTANPGEPRLIDQRSKLEAATL